jgi:hypothetical protein
VDSEPRARLGRLARNEPGVADGGPTIIGRTLDPPKTAEEVTRAFALGYEFHDG